MTSGFRVVDRIDEYQIDDLLELFKHTYWAPHRTYEDVAELIDNTDYNFGVVDESTGRLVGYTRVLSDHVYRAVVYDVVVHPDFRGKGLGRMVLDAVVSHPEIAEIEYLCLFCRPDVVELYRKMGFTDELGGLQLMIRKGPLRIDGKADRER
ncbi:MAG: GNAT family N-acetyltransferase [Methanomassiliicoccales archaeon]|jgi:ribosomal protein S18 acetylase RimI-like enzyme